MRHSRVGGGLRAKPRVGRTAFHPHATANWIERYIPSSQYTSSSKCGGQRSHSGFRGPPKERLYNEAEQRNIHGRSKMDKKQLANALGH